MTIAFLRRSPPMGTTTLPSGSSSEDILLIVGPLKSSPKKYYKACF